MVAVEGGFRTKTGELFNEFPDRVSDTLVLLGAGYAGAPYGPTLGWAAALLSAIKRQSDPGPRRGHGSDRLDLLRRPGVLPSDPLFLYLRSTVPREEVLSWKTDKRIRTGRAEGCRMNAEG